MARYCSVCIHPERDAIEQALAQRTRLAEITARFGPSWSSLSRHNRHHQRLHPPPPPAPPPSPTAPLLLERLQAIYKTTLQIIKDPDRGENPTVLKAIARLEAQCKLIHSIDPTGAYSRTDPAFEPSAFIAEFDSVLQRFPECRRALLEHAEQLRSRS